MLLAAEVLLVLDIHSFRHAVNQYMCVVPCGGVLWATKTVQDRFLERVLGTRVPESPGHKLAK